MNAEPQNSSDAPDRSLRVFVSSTFLDMFDEREELVKQVFPKLRALCEERDVVWTEIELRWGINDEQKAEGKVLPICLSEIRKSNTCFIALLGERYGWVPERSDMPDSLLEAQPWLREHLHHSVTALEIYHGVLNNTDSTCHAHFYFRDPAYLATLPADERQSYGEGPTKEDIAKYGQAEAERRADSRRASLVALKEEIRLRASLIALKEKIREGRFALRDNYPNPRALGAMVLEDLTELIEQLYPKGAEPQPWERDARDHRAFAASRTAVYVERPEKYAAMDAHADGAGLPLAVVGEPGSGKSALLANWAARYRSTHPQAHVITHFIGANAASTDWAQMLGRIMGELKRRLQIAETVPVERAALKLAFANWLHMAAARERVVLVIDGANQLDDRDGALDLAWLPDEIPPNVRVIISAAPGRPLVELDRRGWPRLAVTPLSPAERRELIPSYLSRYSKSLTDGIADRIAKREQTANPLYLRSLLEELRMFGKREELPDLIEHYLAAETVPALYDRILMRCEKDYDRDRPGLVRDAMSLVWAARRGMAEGELRDALGSKEGALLGAYWSPLRFALGQSLIERSGLVGFSHDYFRDAVSKRYLPTEDAQRAARRRLADYFKNRGVGSRSVDELPWQLSMLQSWRELHDRLADLPFFDAAWRADEFEVKEYWTTVERETPLRKVDGYRRVLRAPEEAGDPDRLMSLAALLNDTGNPRESFDLWKHLAAHYRKNYEKNRGSGEKLAKSLTNQGAICIRWQRLDEALSFCREAEALYRGLGDLDGLQRALGNIAVIHHRRKEFGQALEVHEEETRICESLGDMNGLAMSLGSRAAAYQILGQRERAEDLVEKQERLSRQLGNKNALKLVFGTQALLLWARRAYDGALAKLEEQALICRQLGDKEYLQSSLGNQVAILIIQDRLDKAMERVEEQEALCIDLGNREWLASSYGHRGVILRKQGKSGEALRAHEKEVRLYRELDHGEGLQHGLGNMGLAYAALGEADSAMRCFEEKERIARDLGNSAARQEALGWQAEIHESRGGFARALELLREKGQLCGEAGDAEEQARSLIGQAAILGSHMDEPAEALVRAEEALRLARSAGRTSLVEEIEKAIDIIRSILG